MIHLNKVTAFFYKNNIFIMSLKGMKSFDITNYSNFVDITIGKNDINISCKDEKNQVCLNAKNDLTLRLNTLVESVNNVIKRKLVLFGVGFRAWVYKSKNKKSFILLKIGFSRDICLEIPIDIKIVCLKPTLILLKGFDKNKLNQFVSTIRSLKVPDPYKGKGVQYINETIVYKSGKQN